MEHVTRVAARAPYVAMQPASGNVGALLDEDGEPPVLEVSPRRWGVRLLGEERVGLTAPWAGYRWGPVLLPGQSMSVLPSTAPLDSRAEAPQPVGLVGRHRSRRQGEGTEFAAIRPFHAGDRLRRINWRVSLRSGALHVVTTRAEQDAGVLLVVDALADHGRSDGVDGRASSLDVTVRAAAAIAEHHVRAGRPGVAAGDRGRATSSSGTAPARRHLRVLLGRLARVRPGEPRDLAPERLQLRATAGTVVIVLSPMLTDAMGTDRRAARPAWAAGDGGRHAAARRRAGRGARGPTPSSLTWPGGCGDSTASSSSPGCPRSAARSWPGADPAPSTR